MLFFLYPFEIVAEHCSHHNAVCGFNIGYVTLHSCNVQCGYLTLQVVKHLTVRPNGVLTVIKLQCLQCYGD